MTPSQDLRVKDELIVELREHPQQKEEAQALDARWRAWDDELQRLRKELKALRDAQDTLVPTDSSLRSPTPQACATSSGSSLASPRRSGGTLGRAASSMRPCLY